MNIFDKLKGALKRMFSSKSIESVLKISPTVSGEMKAAIELWEDMYCNRAPWNADGKISSLGLAPMIASEKARTATLEMKIKVTGDSERAEFIRNCIEKIEFAIRKNLEYGIALGGLAIKPYVTTGVDGKYKIEFTFVKASDFYPLAFSPEGSIIEAAFLDRIITKEYVYTKLEHHALAGTTLTVKTMAFRSTTRTDTQTYTYSDSDLGNPIPLTEVPIWSSIEPNVIIDNVDTLMFAYFKMPEANNVDLDSPLGVSGFSRATDLIKQADIQYSNLLWEFEGGQLAVDVDRTAFNYIKDAKGRLTEVIPQLQDRLYRRTLDLGEDSFYNVFSPNLRDKNIINGLNTILMHIEDVCSISRGTLSEVTYAEARTATELKILKQRSFSANCDIQKALEIALKHTVDIIDKYCDLYGIVPSGEYEVGYVWDDSIIVDKDAERQVDLLDINAGLLSKVEYRMKWMGETETQATEAIAKINDEKAESMQMQQDIMMNSQMNIDNNKADNGKTQAQAEHDKKVRANESKETTSKNEK